MSMEQSNQEQDVFTIEEAIERLQKECKPYIGIMPQATFASTLNRIRNGTAKFSTMQSFFKRFGYQIREIKLNKLNERV